MSRFKFRSDTPSDRVDGEICSREALPINLASGLREFSELPSLPALLNPLAEFRSNALLTRSQPSITLETACVTPSRAKAAATNSAAVVPV